MTLNDLSGVASAGDGSVDGPEPPALSDEVKATEAARKRIAKPVTDMGNVADLCSAPTPGPYTPIGSVMGFGTFPVPQAASRSK